MAVPVKLPDLSDREACIDAFLRFTQGLDECSEALISSAWTEDALTDLTALKYTTGLDYGITSGRNTIVQNMLQGVGRLDSHHLVSNWRVYVQDDQARMTGVGLAQHYPPTLGPKAEVTSRLLMGNRYYVELRRADDGLWRMAKLVLTNGWSEGDLSVVKH